MKTLDDAVIELGGVFPTLMDEICLFEMEQPPIKTVVTKRQFQQRAKELGFINGYRYGVEYKTDGKRPDLEDDIVVEMRWPDGEWHKDGEDALGEFHCHSFSAFKITDPRYKPADTSYLEKPDSSVDNVNSASFEVTKAHWENAPVWAVDIRNRFGKLYYTDGNFHCKEVDGSGWCKFYSVTKHPVISERPETVIEYKDDSSTGSNGVEVDMIAQAKHEFSTASRAFQDLFKESFDKVIDKMEKERKVKAERDRIISAAESVMLTSRISNTQRKTIARLYDKGFLKLPE